MVQKLNNLLLQTSKLLCECHYYIKVEKNFLCWEFLWKNLNVTNYVTILQLQFSVSYLILHQVYKTLIKCTFMDLQKWKHPCHCTEFDKTFQISFIKKKRAGCYLQWQHIIIKLPPNLMIIALPSNHQLKKIIIIMLCKRHNQQKALTKGLSGNLLAFPLWHNKHVACDSHHDTWKAYYCTACTKIKKGSHLTGTWTCLYVYFK